MRACGVWQVPQSASVRASRCCTLLPRQVIEASVADPWRDPGYWGTARLVLEAGLCLALDAAACDAAGCHKGGVLTPASAMGLVLIERLRQAGITFDITSSPALKQPQGQQQQPERAKQLADAK